MHTEARKRLAAAQEGLVLALVRNEIAPAGFDGARIKATADALLIKRAQSAARAWPRLARSLGPAFDQRFASYARSRPPAQESAALADGRAFARELASEGGAADDARLELLEFDLRYRVISDRVIARRGFSCCAALLKRSLRLTIGVRAPLLGERWISIPLEILLKHHASGSV